MNIFVTKEAQMYSDFWDILKNIQFQVENYFGNIWSNFWKKIGLLFISASGHSVSERSSIKYVRRKSEFDAKKLWRARERESGWSGNKVAPFSEEKMNFESGEICLGAADVVVVVG